MSSSDKRAVSGLRDVSGQNAPTSAQLEITPAKKAPVLSGDRGLHFGNIDEMWRFCTAVVNARTFKEITTPEIALVLLQAGLELGLSPIWSLTNIFVVNGKPAVYGDGLLGLVLSHKDCVDVIETFEGIGDQAVATCEVQRNGRLPVKRSFSVPDAKKAGLWDKAGPWKTYPKRMLQMRARSWACRDSFADVLRGLGVVEELRDVQKHVEAREIERPRLVLPEDENQVVPSEEPSITKCDWLHDDPPCDDPKCWLNKAASPKEELL